MSRDIYTTITLQQLNGFWSTIITAEYSRTVCSLAKLLLANSSMFEGRLLPVCLPVNRISVYISTFFDDDPSPCGGDSELEDFGIWVGYSIPTYRNQTDHDDCNKVSMI
jgi:hypothetical protein